MIKPLNDNFDAHVWAEEFMSLFSGFVCGEEEKIDKSLMIGWFANAIMCGYDYGIRTEKRRTDKLKNLLLLTDPSVSDQEMNSLSAKQWAEWLRYEGLTE